MKHSYTSQVAAKEDGLATGYRIWFGYPVAFSKKPFCRGLFPSGYAISSSEDLCHYLIAQMNNGRYEDSSVVSSKSMDIMHKPVMKGYGMGWLTSSDGVLEHNGQLESYGSQLYIDLKNKRGIALLFNVNRGQGCGHLYQMAASISKLLNGEIVSKVPVDNSINTSIFQLIGLILLFFVWFYLSMKRLRKWTKREVLFIHRLRFWLFLILPLIIEGLIIWIMFKLVPVAIPIAIIHSPDVMSLWLFASISLICWGLIRTIWIVWIFVRNRKTVIR
jgi:hypothetical protein